jgi:hypothetical protein
MVEKMDARPPYISFGHEEIEDRDTSIANGYYTGKQVPFVYLTPSGTKDVIPRNAADWFAQIKRQAMDGKFPHAWLSEYEAAFKRWQETNEMPEFGTPIKTWPVLSPGERDAVLHSNIRTVEDLAQASEQGLQNIGMNARSLKQKAIDWIESATSNGTVVAKLEALRVDNEALKETLQSAMATIAQMKAQQDKRSRQQSASPQEA